MHEKLLGKLTPIREHAEAHGWHCDLVTEKGSDNITEIGALRCWRLDNEGEPTERLWGFGIAFGMNADTGRAVSLDFDARRNWAVVLTDENGDRFWHGPLNTWHDALADPWAWAGETRPIP